MKTYNEIIVDRLRAGCDGLQSTAADIIEEQEITIARKQELMDEAMDLAQDLSKLSKFTASRMIVFEKALRYIHNNPHAHPENVKWVVKDALGLK